MRGALLLSCLLAACGTGPGGSYTANDMARMQAAVMVSQATSNLSAPLMQGPAYYPQQPATYAYQPGGFTVPAWHPEPPVFAPGGACSAHCW